MSSGSLSLSVPIFEMELVRLISYSSWEREEEMPKRLALAGPHSQQALGHGPSSSSLPSFQSGDPERKESSSVKQGLWAEAGSCHRTAVVKRQRSHRTPPRLPPQMRHSTENRLAQGHMAWLPQARIHQARIHLGPPSTLTACGLFPAGKFHLLGLFWSVAGKKETESKPALSPSPALRPCLASHLAKVKDTHPSWLPGWAPAEYPECQ